MANAYLKVPHLCIGTLIPKSPWSAGLRGITELPSGCIFSAQSHTESRDETWVLLLHSKIFSFSGGCRFLWDTAEWLQLCPAEKACRWICYRKVNLRSMWKLVKSSWDFIPSVLMCLVNCQVPSLHSSIKWEWLQTVSPIVTEAKVPFNSNKLN